MQTWKTSIKHENGNWGPIREYSAENEKEAAREALRRSFYNPAEVSKISVEGEDGETIDYRLDPSARHLPGVHRFLSTRCNVCGRTLGTLNFGPDCISCHYGC